MGLNSLLRGTGTAIVTPFAADEKIDFDSLKKLINFIIEGGVNYIVSLGTTGETPTLTREEKQEIVKFTSETIGGRIPLVVGIGGNNTKQVVEDMASMNLYDAVAILSASPYYSKPSQEGLYLHYKTIAEAAKLPLILYNVPGRTGRNMDAATTIRLANEVDNIAGIKEAANNLEQCKEIMANTANDFLVVSGDDDLVAEQLKLGMDGVISVAANCFPKEFSSMVNAGLSGDDETAATINATLQPAYELLFAENNPAGVKAFLFEKKLIQNTLRLPLTPLSSGWHDKIKTYLQGMN